MSLFYPYRYTLIYILLFLNTLNLKYWGGGQLFLQPCIDMQHNITDHVKPTIDVICLITECKQVSIKCESWSYKYATCAAGGPIVSGKVAHKDSKASCTFKQSFGFKDNNLWVDKGCRATFTLRVADGNYRYNCYEDDMYIWYIFQYSV